MRYAFLSERLSTAAEDPTEEATEWGPGMVADSINTTSWLLD